MFASDTDNSCIKSAIIANAIIAVALEALFIAMKLTLFSLRYCDITNTLISLVIFTILNFILGCAGCWFVLFFSIYCRKKYKKKIFKFGKLSRLISAAVHISISLEFIVVFTFGIFITSWNNLDSSFGGSLILYSRIFGGILVVIFGGWIGYCAIKRLVINLKKVKERKIWSIFTKTDVQTREEEDWDTRF